MKKIIVIGGGAAGIMAAYSAGISGSQVVILEKNSMLGKKIRITGKGRCNITSSFDLEEIIKNIYKNGRFMYRSLYTFSNEDLLYLLNANGLRTKVERGGRIFPESDKAIDVVNTLSKIIDMRNIDIVLGAGAKSIEKLEDGRFVVNTYTKGKFYADSVIISTGGLSYPLTGSTGDGYDFAKKFGHSITELNPSLVGMEVKVSERDYSLLPNSMKKLNLRNISVELLKNDKKIYEDFGEFYFREYGIDGPVIKSASCFVDDTKKNRYKIILDLKPALSFEKLDKRIQRDFEKFSNKNFENSLDELLPKSMIDFVIKISEIDRKKKVHQITKEERQKLINSIKGIEFEVVRLRPIDEAIVTSGGVSIKEINPSTMESKIVSGLFFAGEVIDVDGFTGGFNLQIAFSTGYLAGFCASQ